MGFLSLSLPDIRLVRARIHWHHTYSNFHHVLSQEAVCGFWLTHADMRPPSVYDSLLGTSTHLKSSLFRVVSLVHRLCLPVRSWSSEDVLEGRMHSKLVHLQIGGCSDDWQERHPQVMLKSTQLGGTLPGGILLCHLLLWVLGQGDIHTHCLIGKAGMMTAITWEVWEGMHMEASCKCSELRWHNMCCVSVIK